MTQSPASPADAPLRHQRDARGVHHLTLNQPRSFNVLGEAMLTELQGRLDQIAADPDARAVVIGAEGKAFCAGHDLKQMKASPRLDYYQALFAQCSRMMLAILKLPVPVIARVQGLATAAGCQLVAQCDLAVAADSARFGVNGIDVGLFCSTPSVPLVRNIPAKQAMEMLLTGEMIDAATAREFGLVNRVVPPEYLNQVVDKYAATIAAKSPTAVRLGKQAFYAQLEMGLADAYEHTSRVIVDNMLSGDAKEGIGAFMDKRKPEWTGE